MKKIVYTLEGLNEKIEYDLSVDKEYALTHFKKELNWIYELFGREIPKGSFIEIIYHNYRIGNFNHLETMFSKENDLIRQFFPQVQLEKLLNENKIKLKTDKYEFLSSELKDTVFKVIRIAIILLELERKSKDIESPKKNKKKISGIESESFIDLLPDDCTEKQKEYVKNYNNTSPAGLAALVVALGLEKIKPSKLIRALENQYKIKMTPQNFSDFHLYEYSRANKHTVESDNRFIKIQKIKSELKKLIRNID